MTDLTKTVKRVSVGYVREAGKPRQVVVILKPPNIIAFRAKGCRKEYTLTTEVCYVMAVRAAVERERRDKRKTKRNYQKGAKNVSRNKTW